MKKGFTLVELLAVIVILSIIAIITIPMISNVIEKSKLGAIEDSAYGLKKSAELFYGNNLENNYDITFICSDDVCTSSTKKLDFKGKIDSGKVHITDKGKVELCIENDNYSASIRLGEKKVNSFPDSICEEYEIVQNASIRELTEIKSHLKDKGIINNVNDSQSDILNQIDNISLGKNEEIIKSDLLEALQYSNLRLNSESTYDDIISAISDAFPEWDGYLIKNGVVNTDYMYSFTGSTKYIWGASTLSRAPTISFKSGYIEISQSGSSQYPSGLATGTNAIDLSKYNTLKLRYKNNMNTAAVNSIAGGSSAIMSFGISENDSNSAVKKSVDLRTSVSPGNTGVISIDISDLTGSYYLQFNFTGCYHSDGIMSIYLYDIQLDK